MDQYQICYKTNYKEIQIKQDQFSIGRASPFLRL